MPLRLSHQAGALAALLVACADRRVPAPHEPTRPVASATPGSEPALPVRPSAEPEVRIGSARDATASCEGDGRAGAKLPGGECTPRLKRVLRLHTEDGPTSGLFLSRPSRGVVVAGSRSVEVVSERGRRSDRTLAVVDYSPALDRAWSVESAVAPQGVGVKAAALGPDGSLLLSAFLFGGHLAFAGKELGTARPSPGGERAAALFAVDRLGKARWSRLLKGKGNTDVEGLAAGEDGGVYAAGSFFMDADFGDGIVTAPSFESLFLVKYAPDGALGWKRVFAMARHTGRSVNLRLAIQGNELVLAGDYFETLELDGRKLHHDVLLTGPTCIPGGIDPGYSKLRPSGHRSKGIFFARFTLEGKLLSASDLPTPGAWLQELVPAGNGDLLLVGAFQQRINVLGRELRADPAPALACGCSVDCPLRKHDVFLARIAPDGAPRWVRRLEGWDAEPLALPDGSLVLHRKLSTARQPKHFGELLKQVEYRLERVGPDGDLVWQERSSTRIGRPLSLDSEGQLLVGTTFENGPALLIFDGTGGP